MSHFIYHDLGRIEYEKALEHQTAAFNALLEAKAQGLTGENRLFFCEHLPVLTIGKSGKDANLLIPEELLAQRGISFYHINRGGDITARTIHRISGLRSRCLEVGAQAIHRQVGGNDYPFFGSLWHYRRAARRSYRRVDRS